MNRGMPHGRISKESKQTYSIPLGPMGGHILHPEIGFRDVTCDGKETDRGAPVLG